MDLKALLLAGANAIATVINAGGDIAVAIKIAKKMAAVATSAVDPGQADFDYIDALAQPELDALNDKSRDT